MCMGLRRSVTVLLNSTTLTGLENPYFQVPEPEVHENHDGDEAMEDVADVFPVGPPLPRGFEDLSMLFSYACHVVVSLLTNVNNVSVFIF